MEKYMKSMPLFNTDFNNPFQFDAIASTTTTTPSDFSLSTAFDGEHISSTLSGLGTGIGLISGLVNSNRDNKMKKKLYNLEKDRIDRANRKEDKFHDGMKSSWG